MAEENAERCRLKRRQISMDKLSGWAEAVKIDSEMDNLSVIVNAWIEETV